MASDYTLTHVFLRAIIISKRGHTLKYSELIKKLKRAGCTLIEHGKEHDKWYSPITGKTFRIPRHQTQDVKKGTLGSIMKDAGLK